MQWGAAHATPQLIASMSLRLVIPGWVALSRAHLRFASRVNHAKQEID